MFSDWKNSDIFSSVEWEDTGLRGTIFDEYDTPEHAQRLAELEEFLAGELGAVANEILIRSRDLDPVLPDALHVHDWDAQESLDECPHPFFLRSQFHLRSMFAPSPRAWQPRRLSTCSTS